MKWRLLSKNEKITLCVYTVVLFSFLIPAGFLVWKIFSAESAAMDKDFRSKADYALMLLQCILGVIVLHLPMALQKKFKFELPTALYVMYIVFLYCAIFLGEVKKFYYIVPHWDIVQHCFSSIMAGAFGFIVVAVLNRDERTPINLSPFFVALFAFCFAVTVGSIWEIYEFTFDGLLGINMQKFILPDKTILSGHAALTDTMKDISVDCLGALAASVTGYFSLKNSRGWASDLISKYCVENLCDASANSEKCINRIK